MIEPFNLVKATKIQI